MVQHIVASYEIAVLRQLYTTGSFFTFHFFTSYKLYGAWKRASSPKSLLFFVFLLHIILWKLTLSVVSLHVAGEVTGKKKRQLKGHGNEADFLGFLHKLVRHRSFTVHFEPFRFWLRIRGDIRNRKTTPRLGESGSRRECLEIQVFSSL
jgi:hypothetical protein